MNIKRYWYAVLASFVTMTFVGTVINDIAFDYLMSPTDQTGSVKEFIDMAPIMMGAYLIINMIFAYFYVKMRQTGHIKEGIKFGFLFSLIISCMTLVDYSIFQFEFSSLISDSILNLITYVTGGIVVSLVYKPAS